MAIVLDGTLGLTYTGDTAASNNLAVPGNVGVGTSSPVSNTNQRSVTINGTSFSRVDFQTGGSSNAYIYSGLSNTNLGTIGSTFIAFDTNSTERVRIDSSGNVGIGTTTLTNKLNVAGAVQSSATLTAVAANTIAMSQESSYGRIAAFGPNATTAGTLYLYVIDSAGGNQRGMVIASDGQLYHNSTYLVGTAYNHYWAKSTTAISPVSSGWTDVQLQWSNVVIPTNVRKVLLTFHITFRNNGVTVNHSGFRMKVTNTSTSVVTFVGNASWGFGISQCVGNTTGQNHMTVSQHVNLLDYDSSGNQAGLAAGSTYNMMLQVTDAYGNGTTLRVAAEAGGAHTDYTPAHGSIWII